ncbi:RNA polymerase sigma factor [Lewinella sp. W8]|uniref:RNA polymerase sigma factor n=1 Tax=Lewinella sp. W8 TaxID=2528208 RepID=UPI0012B53A77
MQIPADFVDFIQRHAGLIYKAAGLYTTSVADKEDLAQEIIFQLWKSRHTYAGKAAASTWLYRVAVNVALHHQRMEGRRRDRYPLEATTAPPHAASDEVEADRWELLRPHLATLSRLEKGILFLYLEEKSYADIADITGLSETNVGSRLNRIRQKLRRSVNAN